MKKGQNSSLCAKKDKCEKRTKFITANVFFVFFAIFNKVNRPNKRLNCLKERNHVFETLKKDNMKNWQE